MVVFSLPLVSSISIKTLAFHDTIDFTTCICFFERLTFIVKFLAFAQGDNTFCFAPFRKVNAKGDQGEAAFFGATNESQQFAFVQKQLAYALGSMVPNRRLPIFFDFAADQPKLAIFDTCVSLIDRAFAVSKTLDFAAVEDHSAFDGVQYLVLMFGFSIVSHHFVRDSARSLCHWDFGVFGFGFGRLRFGWSRLLGFFLIQWLPADVCFWRSELKNCKTLVELSWGWIQDWQEWKILSSDSTI